ncbi:MAG TPA: tryptophan synthase subunit alpha [Candidatus Kryptonia bacterium]|nr:tryptophan synthase subunit alpha [Candidatus Kryptonia bacterium]
MSDRIEGCFRDLRAHGERALVAFIMAGDPDMARTRALVHAAATAGADIIELGVPFSDPTSDGPVLQRSAERALAHNVSLPRVLELVHELRQESVPVPLILFGYFNPIFRYGCERFARDAARAGVDGVLVVDLPPEEAGELRRFTDPAGVDIIHLLAPTSDSDRMRKVLARARGFVYYVSLTGVTGVREVTPADVRPMVEKVKRQTKLPVGVGFGITTPEQAAAVAQFADAVVVGTAIMRIIEAHATAPDLVERVSQFIHSLKAAMRNGASSGA